MANLTKYVDVKEYCSELSKITNVAVSEVENIVVVVFGCINDGEVDPYNGFLIIESKLAEKANQRKKLLAI